MRYSLLVCLLMSTLFASKMAAIAQRLAGAVKTAHKQREGGGFIVRRPFPSGSTETVGGVFLMLDHMGPVTYGPGEAVGAPDHPHRGFETVTYVLEGSMQHKDSAGNAGNLRSGDVQWMTAGSGVVHSEMPSDEMQKSGGTLEGFQLWVNLRAADKMVPPRYQDTPADRLPLVPVPGAAHADSAVKVIVGAFAGVAGPIEARSPMGYYDVRLGPGDSVSQLIPDGHAGFVYVYRGTAALGANAVAASEGDWAPITGSSGAFTLACPAGAGATMRALLLHGEPIDEPIARHGPFVMNSRAELVQAFEDFQSGRLGRIDGAAARLAATEAARQAQKASGTWQKGEL